MEKISEKKEVLKFAYMLTFIYMISYITRINYGAIISEMERTTMLSKSMLSMALTGSFVTYGVGQVISGICGDKFSPKKLISYGLIVTIIMNILIPFCNSPYQMLVVWCINGFAQAFMWPPIVRLMTYLLSDEDYKKTSVKVSWGSSFGTIFVYFTAPLIITLSGWKAVFFVSALCGAIMLIIWNKCSYDVKVVKKEKKEHKEKSGIKFISPILIMVMLAIILQGMLRDGVTTWMPSYITETYHISNRISILTGVILPLFSIFCFNIAAWMYKEKLKNPLTCAGFIFVIGAISAIMLFMFTGKSAVMSVLFSALLTGAMHGVNIILNCMIPPFFKKYGSVSTVSGILNSCTYIGSATSSYGIAALSENFGWTFTLSTWVLITVLGSLVCLLTAKPWRKKYM